MFIPTLSKLGYEARHIVGTTVIAVTATTFAGSIAYAQNGVTDIPAAVCMGTAAAMTTPVGVAISRKLSGRQMRKLLGASLLLCSPSVLFSKKKDWTKCEEAGQGDGSGDGECHKAELERKAAAKSVAAATYAQMNLFDVIEHQFRQRFETCGGAGQFLWKESEYLALGVAVGLMQGTVGVGGGVLVTTYLSTFGGDMEVHTICATSLLTTLLTNTVRRRRLTSG